SRTSITTSPSSRAARRALPMRGTILPTAVLFVQPRVLEPGVIIDAVGVGGVALDVGVPAVPRQAVLDDWPRGILDQDTLNLPNQLAPLLPIDLLRLFCQQLIDFRIAILGVIPLRLAGIIFHEVAVGVVDADAGQVEADCVILARHLGVPL